jgi:hypothetical protein
MVAAVEWDAVTLAGAFILGTVFATIGVLRVIRAVFAIRRREERQDKP